MGKVWGRYRGNVPKQARAWLAIGKCEGVESACSAISDYWGFYSAIYTLVHPIRIYLGIEEPKSKRVYCDR